MLKYLKMMVCVVVGLVLGVLVVLVNFYEDYVGEILVVNFLVYLYFDVVMKVLLEFIKEIGICVEVDQLQYFKMCECQILELMKNCGDYDLIVYVVFFKVDYVYVDQLENFVCFFMNLKLVDLNYEVEDLIDGYVVNIGVVGGKKGYLLGLIGLLFGLLFGLEIFIFGYCKDIFEKYDFKVFQIYEELFEFVCLILELELGMGGLVLCVVFGYYVSYVFFLYFVLLGGCIFDDEWKLIVNNVEGV